MTSSSTTIATTPTIASSLSPYCCSELSSVVASRNVTMLTPRPASAPSSTGRRLRRFAPSRLAVIAARISTRLEALAEDDDRRVGDHRRLRGGVAERGRGVGELLVERRPRRPDLARAAPCSPTSSARPGSVARAEPDQALDLRGQRGVERLQAPLRPELEDRVELHARLLGLAVAGRPPPAARAGRARSGSGRSRPRPTAPPRRPGRAPSSALADRLAAAPRRRRPPARAPGCSCAPRSTASSSARRASTSAVARASIRAQRALAGRRRRPAPRSRTRGPPGSRTGP